MNWWSGTKTIISQESKNGILSVDIGISCDEFCKLDGDAVLSAKAFCLS